jgi:very-short-patch-repair endonuclease
MEYLTEKLLLQFLLKNIDSSGICNKQFPGYKFRPDFVSHDLKFVVEFDGYLHYTKSKTVLDDVDKDKIISDLNYSIIRIPYFVQLDSRVMEHLFGNYLENFFDFVRYPHGFIDSSAILPADFCTLGVERFRKDLKRFDFIKNEILISLQNKTKRNLEVLPLKFEI